MLKPITNNKKTKKTTGPKWCKRCQTDTHNDARSSFCKKRASNKKNGSGCSENTNFISSQQPISASKENPVAGSICVEINTVRKKTAENATEKSVSSNNSGYKSFESLSAEDSDLEEQKLFRKLECMSLYENEDLEFSDHEDF